MGVSVVCRVNQVSLTYHLINLDPGSSAYEAYDRLSPYYQKFLEGLTALHSAPFFVDSAKAKGVPVRENRGSPDNKGQHLSTSHPVIRTNPVTGWKGLFVNRGFTKKINELNQDESDNVLEFLWAHVAAVRRKPQA